MAYKKQKLISHSLEVGKSQIMASAELVSDDGLLPGLQLAIFSLCPHMSEKDKGIVWDLFYKRTNAIHEICALIT